MGLDGVELVMEFEDEFGIQIPDAIAGSLTTIGETVDTIVGLLMQKPNSGQFCASARSFYRLRQELRSRFDTPRDLIKSDVPIGMLVPPSQEHQWKQVADAADLRREPRPQSFPDPQMKLRTLISTHCKAGWRRVDGALDRDAVYRQICQITSEQLGVPIQTLSPGSRFAQDLGIG